MRPQGEEAYIQGIPICRGIAIGPLFFLNRDKIDVPEWTVSPTKITEEIDRYRHAISRSKQDLKRLKKQLEAEEATEGVAILNTQLEILQDPIITLEVEKRIQDALKNAEYAFLRVIEKCELKFKTIKDPYFFERVNDLQDLARRVINHLKESRGLSLPDLPPYSIVCTKELSTSDAAEASPHIVNAFITQWGGATSHTAIMAKSKGIPYVSNIDLALLKEKANGTVIVDGRSGKIIINPTEKTVSQYRALYERMNKQAINVHSISQRAAETVDGFTVRVTANLEIIQEIEIIHQSGGEGIGLFRSEYIFLPKSEIPSEDEQVKIYSEVVDKMKGLPVVIRTFDLGGDKAQLQSTVNSGRSPFFGCSATRFLLKEKELFKAQIRAILQSNKKGNVSVLFPMVSTFKELLEAKKMVKEAQEEVGAKHEIRIGCMIEIPSAALEADHFVKECDFLSIGTNDLSQYALAVDRGDHQVNDMNAPIDPSVIRLIKIVVEAANKQQIPVSVCGEVASDPRYTPLLLGLGIQELSVAPCFIPLIKNAVRNTSIVEAVALAEKSLQLASSQEILDLLTKQYKKTTPQDLLFSY